MDETSPLCSNRPMGFGSKAALLSFSGIDGAGKSTQIERLCSRLLQEKLRFERLALWDDVVLLAHVRADLSRRVLNSEEGVGAPGKPVQRSDKNVRRWYLTAARSILYFCDALRLRYAITRAREHSSVVVLDRYIYDQLANIPFNWLGRIYIRVVLRIVPRPDIAFLLDADPEAALHRKPEYPLDFLEKYRKAFLGLLALVPGMVIVPASDVDTVEQWIARHIKTQRLLELTAYDDEAISTS